MKRQVIYTICAFLLLAIATVGSTYAFFSATVNSNTGAVVADAQNFEVIYTGDTAISGSMPITYEKTNDFKKTINIRVAQDSTEAKGDIYIYINQMTSNLSIDGFIWEVYGYKNNELVYSDTGTFKNYNSTSNNRLDIVKNYKITKTNTSFDIYLWIDGEQIDNNILGANFSGYIGANTEQVTGQLS